MSKNVQNVFLIGAKSLGAYGGYETFIDKLTDYHQNIAELKYHVACKQNGEGSMDPYNTPGVNIINDYEFIYHNSRCFQIKVPEWLGPSQAIYYDLKALSYSIKYIEENEIEHPIIYIMACRIGPFLKYFYKRVKDLGGKIYINPDGHEFLRAKWSKPIQEYWKLSEKLMTKWSDLVICDSKTIEEYIHQSYDRKGINGQNPNTTFIAYGAEFQNINIDNYKYKYNQWLSEHCVLEQKYYLIVGRFVPENNYETMIREFMASKTEKDLVIVTNTNDSYLSYLERKLNFQSDKRIKFVGTVYDKELLYAIRSGAYGYLHGHEVGGTNPSLLESLGSTKLNLLLDVGFNREVAENAAVYWKKEANSLSTLLDNLDNLTSNQINNLGSMAKKRIKTEYSWEKICQQYYEVFTK